MGVRAPTLPGVALPCLLLAESGSSHHCKRLRSKADATRLRLSPRHSSKFSSLQSSSLLDIFLRMLHYSILSLWYTLGMAGDQFDKPQFPNNLDRIRGIISHIL